MIDTQKLENIGATLVAEHAAGIFESRGAGERFGLTEVEREYLAADTRSAPLKDFRAFGRECGGVLARWNIDRLRAGDKDEEIAPDRQRQTDRWFGNLQNAGCSDEQIAAYGDAMATEFDTRLKKLMARWRREVERST